VVVVVVMVMGKQLLACVLIYMVSAVLARCVGMFVVCCASLHCHLDEAVVVVVVLVLCYELRAGAMRTRSSKAAAAAAAAARRPLAAG
jgi:hypothetical protein